MPRYKATEPGFFNGKLFGPKGKRRIVVTDRPFPKSTKGLPKGKKAVEQVPSWLERLPDDSLADEKARKEIEAQVAADAEKSKEDIKDIGDASFMTSDESDSGVETL